MSAASTNLAAVPQVITQFRTGLSLLAYYGDGH
jgi:hypothetical protein